MRIPTVIFYLTAALPLLLFGSRTGAGSRSSRPVAQGLSRVELSRNHYTLAARAAEQGDCVKMRDELGKAASLGWAPDLGQVHKWGYECGAPIEDGVRYSAHLASLTVSAAGDVAVAAGPYGRLFILNLAANKAGLWETGLADVKSIDISPDAKLIAVGGDRKVIVKHTSTGKDLWSGELDAYVTRLRFSQRGDYLVVGLNKRMTSGIDRSVRMEGMIRRIAVSDPGMDVSMESVPGNPVDLAITPDGRNIVAICWSRDYTFSTVAWLCSWDAETGQQQFSRRLRTTTGLPARLSRDARVAVYSKIDPSSLLKYQHTLNRKGRIKKVRDVASSSWMRDIANFTATANYVFQDQETPIAGGAEVMALDESGRRAVIKTGADKLMCAEIGTDSLYGIGFHAQLSAEGFEIFAEFGGGGSVLVIGSKNDNLTRFGWLGKELPGAAAIAGREDFSESLPLPSR